MTSLTKYWILAGFVAVFCQNHSPAWFSITVYIIMVVGFITDCAISERILKGERDSSGDTCSTSTHILFTDQPVSK